MRYIILFIIALVPVLMFGQTKFGNLEKLFFSHKYDEAIAVADSILKVNSADVNANTFMGESLIYKKKYADAVSFLNRALKSDTANDVRKMWVTLYKGVALFQLDKYQDAKHCIDECMKMKSVVYKINEAKNLAVNLGFDEYYKNWEIIENTHFRFHFPPTSNVKNKNKFINSYDKAFDKINSFFEAKIPKRIDIIVWNSKEDAEKLGIKNLAFSIISFTVIHTTKYNTVGHEMTHIISRYVPSEPTSVNMFVEEGTATYFDQTNESKIERAKKIMKKEKYTSNINLENVWKNPKAYPEWISYFLGSEVMKILIKNYGREKFISLIHNQTYKSAKFIYGSKLGDVLKEVENMLK